MQLWSWRPKAGKLRGVLNLTLSVERANASLRESSSVLCWPLPRCHGNGAASAHRQRPRLGLP